MTGILEQPHQCWLHWYYCSNILRDEFRRVHTTLNSERKVFSQADDGRANPPTKCTIKNCRHESNNGWALHPNNFFFSIFFFTQRCHLLSHISKPTDAHTSKGATSRTGTHLQRWNPHCARPQRRTPTAPVFSAPKVPPRVFICKGVLKYAVRWYRTTVRRYRTPVRRYRTSILLVY